MRIFFLLLIWHCTFHTCQTQANIPPVSTELVETKENRLISQKVQQRLEGEDELSSSAKNIEIFTDDRSITLKGEVESRAELNTVQNLAKLEAWDKVISNRLTVRPYQQRNYINLYD